MGKIIPVKSPDVLLIPGVQGLLHRGFAENYLIPSGFDGAVEEFVSFAKDPKVGFYLATDDGGKFKGFVIVILPRTALAPYPQVLHIYSEGRAAVAQGLIDAGVAFMRSNGYSKFWALNGSKVSDEVWSRAFRRAGVATPLASLMEFEL